MTTGMIRKACSFIQYGIRVSLYSIEYGRFYIFWNMGIFIQHEIRVALYNMEYG